MIKILIGGDLCPVNRTEEYVITNRSHLLIDELYSYIAQKDLFITNLECPLTTKNYPINKTGPALKCTPKSINLLSKLSIDIVALANNHILDFGESALFETISLLDSCGVKYVGAGKDLTTARKPLVIDIKQKKIGILNFAENEYSIATNHSGGANPFDLINNYYDIKNIKKETDFLILYLHGGNEHYKLPNPYLVKACRFFVDVGVNAIFISHSHFPTGYEIYNGAPIFYGLGNFIFDWPNPGSNSWNFGYLVELNLDPIISFKIIPFSQFYKDNLGIRILNDSDKEIFDNDLEKLSKIIKNDDELSFEWQKYISENKTLIYGNILQFNPIIKRIAKHFGLYKSKKNKTRLMSLLNAIRCESYYYLYRDGLNDINKT